jgi:His-Xaa-Ser system radical SAM maturase HxsC
VISVVRKDLFTLPAAAPPSYGYAVLLTHEPDGPSPYLDQILIAPIDDSENIPVGETIRGVICDPEIYNTIENGDIGFINTRGNLRVVLSRRANHNTLLVTERCDNRCRFCSQPPKEADDDWLLVQAAMAIAAFRSAETIGISGGEPLLYRQTFLRFLDFIAEHSPETPLHILSNGRAFADRDYAVAVAERCKALSMTFGIPLYSAVSTRHDRLVGAQGAFAETVKGLINAGNSGISIELRIIPTKENVTDIAATVVLAARCFTSLSQISIMNLEPTGWAKKNWPELYLEPQDYVDELIEAVEMAGRAALSACLFNYPLCHLPPELRPFAVKSISDWKNYYPDECTGCHVKQDCTGYFASAKGRFLQAPRRIL